MKTTILLLLLSISLNTFSQCPGATAQSYKTKMQNAGSNIEASGAYGGLAAYYAYKCECKNGTNRGPQLINMMNGLVATNSQYYKNKYGTISRVSSCKSLGSGANGVSGKTASGSSVVNKVQQLGDVSGKVLGEDHVVTQSFRNYNKGVEIRNSIDNKDYIGAATNLISIFANSKRRKNKPITPEETKRLKALQLKKQIAEQEISINTELNKVGITQINDTTLIRIAVGKKMIMTHKPIDPIKPEFIITSRKIYDFKTGKLLAEEFANERYLDGSIKIGTEIYYEKGIFLKSHINTEGKLSKVIDLITDEVIYERESRVKEKIKNKKGEIIGDKIYYNNLLYQVNYFNKEKFVKRRIYYYGGVRYEERYFVLFEGKKIPATSIDYDYQGVIKEKTTATIKQLKKGIQIVTYYDKGIPKKEITYKNGAILNEKIIKTEN